MTDLLNLNFQFDIDMNETKQLHPQNDEIFAIELMVNDVFQRQIQNEPNAQNQKIPDPIFQQASI